MDYDKYAPFQGIPMLESCLFLSSVYLFFLLFLFIFLCFKFRKCFYQFECIGMGSYIVLLCIVAGRQSLTCFISVCCRWLWLRCFSGGNTWLFSLVRYRTLDQTSTEPENWTRYQRKQTCPNTCQLNMTCSDSQWRLYTNHVFRRSAIFGKWLKVQYGLWQCRPI